MINRWTINGKLYIMRKTLILLLAALGLNTAMYGQSYAKGMSAKNNSDVLELVAKGQYPMAVVQGKDETKILTTEREWPSQTDIAATMNGVNALAVAAKGQGHGAEVTVQPFTAHEESGRFFAGGALTLWNNSEDKHFMFDLCPEFGYLFNEDWGLGMLLGYEYEKSTKGEERISAHGFKVSPFARYYYLHKGPFNLYLDGGFGLNWTKEKNKATQQTTNLHGWEIGIRPGACVDLTEGLCLCMRIGFAGYRKDYVMGEEPKIGSNGFGILFAPEDLMIGLELEF